MNKTVSWLVASMICVLGTGLLAGTAFLPKSGDKCILPYVPPAAPPPVGAHGYRTPSVWTNINICGPAGLTNISSMLFVQRAGTNRGGVFGNTPVYTNGYGLSLYVHSADGDYCWVIADNVSDDPDLPPVAPTNVYVYASSLVITTNILTTTLWSDDGGSGSLGPLAWE